MTLSTGRAPRPDIRRDYTADWPLPGSRLRTQVRTHFGVLRERAGNAPRYLDGLRRVLLAHEHVPERELRLGVTGPVGLRLCRFAQRRQRLLFVAAAEHPARAPGHARVHDVIDPGAGDAGADVLRGGLEDGIERGSRLPGLVPSRFPAEQAELQPDVVQVELPEVKERGLVLRIFLQDPLRRR